MKTEVVAHGIEYNKIRWLGCPECRSRDIASRNEHGEFRCDKCDCVFRITSAEECPTNRPRYLRPVIEKGMLRLENIDKLNCELYDTFTYHDKLRERVEKLETLMWGKKSNDKT